MSNSCSLPGRTPCTAARENRAGDLLPHAPSPSRSAAADCPPHAGDRSGEWLAVNLDSIGFRPAPADVLVVLTRYTRPE